MSLCQKPLDTVDLDAFVNLKQVIYMSACFEGCSPNCHLIASLDGIFCLSVYYITLLASQTTT